jgi:phage gpG-like protein
MALNNQNIQGADELVRKLKEAEEYIQNDVPQVIGTEAVKHFKGAFATEGLDGNKWADRKTKVRLQKKILTGQGSGDHLGDSIDFKVAGQTITIFTDKPYAQIHNEGGEITVTSQMRRFFWAKSKEAKEAGDLDAAEQFKYMALSSTIKIPKREFMGNSEQLNNNIIAKITRDLDTILK